MLNRRKIITGLISFAVTAPAIVRADSLMNVKVVKFDPAEVMKTLTDYIDVPSPFSVDSIQWCRVSYDETGRIIKTWIDSRLVHIDEQGAVKIDHS